MARCAGLRDAKRVDEVADAPLAPAEEGQEAEARGVGEGVEQ